MFYKNKIINKRGGYVGGDCVTMNRIALAAGPVGGSNQSCSIRQPNLTLSSWLGYRDERRLRQ